MATARPLHPQTSHSSLGEMLELGEIDENDLYRAMDWLVARQGHMRRALAPVLFDDEHRGEAKISPVAPAPRSPSALRKAREKKTDDGFPVQSFQDWLRDLATITKNHIQPKMHSLPAFDVITRPTPSQAHALKLLGVSL